MILKLLAAAAAFMQPTYDVDSVNPRAIPTVSVSAVRSILCDNWLGSGFLIGDKMLLTALHVAEGTHCRDADTGGQLYVYKTDKDHDLAMMTGPSLPTNIPYIKISCEPFKTAQPYLSWGRSSFGMDDVISRMNVIVATKDYVTDKLIDGTPFFHMRKLTGYIAPGMSGGPVTDLHGVAHSVNNAGSKTETIVYEFADGMLCKP